jgi:hypothetical protein
MFCPKCSQAQPAEDLRFCPRCGFPLVAVKELVGREERGDDRAGAGKESMLPAQKDLATGALLMFAGSVVALLWGFMGTRGPAETLLPQAYFILGGTLAFLLTLFHPLLGSLEKLTTGGEAAAYTQRRRDGINLGALLMFVGALKATLLTSLMPLGPERGVTPLAVAAGMLILVLLLRPILLAARGLFLGRQRGVESAETAETTETGRLGGNGQGAALPPAQSIPANDFMSPRPDTAEQAAPPSVTEETTRKLSR